MNYHTAYVDFGMNKGVFRPVMQAVNNSLVELNRYGDDRQILFGSWAIPKDADVADVILMNMEVVDSCPATMRNYHLELLKSREVWDYSKQNINRFKAHGIEAKLLNIGYSPSYRFDTGGEKDIDVFFIGSINERRKHILSSLIDRGLNVCVPYNVFGKELQEYQRRSKVFLNMHYYEDSPLNMVRLAPLWSNGLFALSENVHDADYIDFEPQMCLSDYDDLIEDTCYWVSHDRERNEQAMFAYEQFKKFSQTDYLRPLLEN